MVERKVLGNEIYTMSNPGDDLEGLVEFHKEVKWDEDSILIP